VEIEAKAQSESCELKILKKVRLSKLEAVD